jgi:eukaryotic-like serine/threonine-protein kinase
MLEIVEDMTLEAGQVVANRYRLDRIVGEGGMGVVWAATHILTEKRCALKFLKGDRSGDPKGQMRLLHEARAICRIRHPNVAQVHDVLELTNGAPFLVMDLLDGEPLSARVEAKGKLSASELLTILPPLVSAVRAAHELGLVHRDLKPDNVFLERHGGLESVRVLDFGIAKRFDIGEPGPSAASLFTSRRSLTNTNTIVGTPAYMAPEQLRLGTVIGPPVDVFALGVLAYECALGELPPRDDRTYLMLHQEVRARLAAREPPLPAALAELFAQAMCDEPAERPTLEAFARVLTELVGSSGNLPAAAAVASEPALAATMPLGVASPAAIARTSIMTPTPAAAPGPPPTPTFLASSSSVASPAPGRSKAALLFLAIALAVGALGLLLIARSRSTTPHGVEGASPASAAAPSGASSAELPPAQSPAAASAAPSAVPSSSSAPPAIAAASAARADTPRPRGSAKRPSLVPSTPAASNHETIPAYDRE